MATAWPVEDPFLPQRPPDLPRARTSLLCAVRTRDVTKCTDAPMR